MSFFYKIDNLFSIYISPRRLGFHFFLDKKAKQKNQAAKKALLRLPLPPPTV